MVKYYSNENDSLKNKNNLLNNEIINLNNDLNNTLKINQRFEIDNKNLIKNLNNNNNFIYNNINNLINWMETYLGVYYDKSIVIPDIPIIKNDEEIYINLSKKIFDIRNKINNSLKNYEETILVLKKEQIDLLNKFETINKEFIMLKNENYCLKKNCKYN